MGTASENRDMAIAKIVNMPDEQVLKVLMFPDILMPGENGIKDAFLACAFRNGQVKL